MSYIQVSFGKHIVKDQRVLYYPKSVRHDVKCAEVYLVIYPPMIKIVIVKIIIG